MAKYVGYLQSIIAVAILNSIHWSSFIFSQYNLFKYSDTVALATIILTNGSTIDTIAIM